MPYTRVEFPTLGWSDSVAFRVGDRRVAQEAENVLPRDPWQERRRIGSRQGFVAVHDIPSTLPSDETIQWMGSYRVYRDGTLVQGVIVVADGVAYDMTVSGVTGLVDNSLHPLAGTDSIEAVVHLGKVYIVNGRWYYEIDLQEATPTVENWTETDIGVDPATELVGPQSMVKANGVAAGSGGFGATLITSFGARLVLAGVESSATNWYMSAVSDPGNWKPVFGTGSAAGGVAGGSTDAYGLLGEPITAIFPVGSSGLMLGTARTLSQLTGDPQFADTRLVTISRSVGAAGPRAWCAGPEKTAYVCSTDGVYRVAPNTFGLDRGDRLTADRLDGFFATADFLDVSPVLAYDDHQHILWLFANRTDEPTLSLHYAMDATTGSWWPVRIADPRLPVVRSWTRFQPLSGERPVLWCGGPSRISTQPPTGVYPHDGMSLPGSPYNLPEEGDPGVPFTSSILMGPYNMPPGERILLRDVRVVLGADRQSDAVSDQTGLGPQLTVIAGASAQEAIGESGDLIVSWALLHELDGGVVGDVLPWVDGGGPATVAWDDVAVGGFPYPIVGRYSPQSTALPGSQAAYAGPGQYVIEREAGGRWKLTGPNGTGGRITYHRTASASVSPSGQYPNELGFADVSVLDAVQGGFAAREVAQERPLRRGMNNALRMRVRASDIYLGIEATGRLWSLEDMSIDAVPGGKVRQWHELDTDPGLELERP